MRQFFSLLFTAGLGLILSCAPQGTETGDEDNTASDIVTGQKREEVHLGHPTVLQILEESEQTQMLQDALRFTGLDAELNEGGPYTLFAPTDDAFESLDSLGINNIPADMDSAELRQILLHHVVEGNYTATEIAQMEELPTLSGTPLRIVTSNDNITVDGADIIMNDREADNGYVHLIDSVLVSS